MLPDTLYMFLNILYGRQDVFEEEGDNDVQEEGDMDKEGSNDILLSVTQNLIYVVSEGKLWTPKHVGLGCSLHQSTRSKQLVQLFHKAGHIISYKNILQLDNAMEEVTLRSVDHSTGGILLPNLVQYQFMHFTADNIDILDSSLDGKDTFHATQLSA